MPNIFCPVSRLFAELPLRCFHRRCFFVHLSAGKHPDIITIEGTVLPKQQNAAFPRESNDMSGVTAMNPGCLLFSTVRQHRFFHHNTPPESIEEFFHERKRYARRSGVCKV